MHCNLPVDRSGPTQPAPFIVGVGRSGTTLLRIMLDAHPDMAIPSETHVIPRLAALEGASGDLRKRFVHTLTAGPTWSDIPLEMSEIAAAMRQIDPFEITEAVRTLYCLYADKQGKRRWGDKTPQYHRHMRRIAALLPEARFVHIIRDGRDVAVSGRKLWFGPGESMRAQATNWARSIRASRQQARYLEHYLEVFYEDLVRQPEKTLRRICEFVELPFDPRMLTYYRRAGQRLAEIDERRDRHGSLIASSHMRRAIHARVQLPPDDSRIGRWKNEMSEQEHAEFLEVAGNMLRDLEYETPQ